MRTNALISTAIMRTNAPIIHFYVAYSNEKAMKAMERKNHVKQRWSYESNVFISAKIRLIEKQKSDVVMKLHCMASERCFLLELKRKYSGSLLYK